MKADKIVAKIKELMNKPYDEKELKPFMDIMCGEVQDFIYGSTYIDQFERASEPFKIMTKYHREAMESGNTKYRQRYYSVALIGEEAIDLSVFNVENLGVKVVDDLKKTPGTLQYEN